MIPKNFFDFTCAICCPLIINDCVRLASFRCLRNNTKWVLSVFKVSLLALNQSMIFIISLFIVLTNSLGLSPDIKRFESSANKILNKTLETFARSLMYKRKRSGPKIDPCGIPQVISLSTDFVPALTLSQCTLAGPVYTGKPLECHWMTQCTLGYHWAPSEYLQGTLEHHWKNLVETAPHWNATAET